MRGKQSDAQQGKAATLAAVLEELGVAADDAVMVGDRHFDVDAALACGVPCVGVTYGGTAPFGELDQAGAAFFSAADAPLCAPRDAERLLRECSAPA